VEIILGQAQSRRRNAGSAMKRLITLRQALESKDWHGKTRFTGTR
jgi:hypothetical protein